MKILNRVLLLSFVVAAFSCGDGQPPVNNDPVEQPSVDVTQDDEEDILEEDDDEITFVFPSAIEIMAVFKHAGLQYLEDVSHSPKKSEEYNSKFSKAVITGVYTTDLAYSVLNNQNQKAIEYLNTVSKISEGLGINALAESGDLLKRFESSLGNEEETFEIMTEIQELTDEYVSENDMEGLATLIFSGAWVEGMYIGVMANDDYSKSKISQRVSEQMRILENLLKVLDRSGMDSDEYKKFYADMKSLNDYYMNLDEVKNREPRKRIVLSVEQLKTIAAKIVKLRTSLV